MCSQKHSRKKALAELMSAVLLTAVAIVFLLVVTAYFTTQYNTYKGMLENTSQTRMLQVVDTFYCKKDSTLVLILYGEGNVKAVYLDRTLVSEPGAEIIVSGTRILHLALPSPPTPDSLVRVVTDWGEITCSVSGLRDEVVEYEE